MPANIKYPVIDGMKQCGDCKEWKPIAAYKPARTHYTSRCDVCIRVYHKAFRARPEKKEKAAAYAAAYMGDVENRLRKNSYFKEWRKLPHAKDGRNETRRVWAAREKRKSVEYKGGKCVVCGYSACLGAMDFHHPDPSQKEGLKAHWSFERNKPELDKCVLVCSRCHREIHAGFTKL